MLSCLSYVGIEMKNPLFTRQVSASLFGNLPRKQWVAAKRVTAWLKNKKAPLVRALLLSDCSLVV